MTRPPAPALRLVPPPDDDLAAFAYALIVAHAVNPQTTILVGRGLDSLDAARKERGT